ncbi:MAG TPA: antibiotic biosynthesis monooxygenase family protein [Chthoniobacterales bacterium]|nr:antibiotic biosynthesis monooxygenase family protein [Chthoniobacterales bacterium]
MRPGDASDGLRKVLRTGGSCVYPLARMEGVCVIVAYRPKPGKEADLLEVVRSRVPLLRQEGLVSERVPIIVRAQDGTLIEVSEWKSRAAIDAAHRNPNVLALWNKFFALCDCVPLNTVAETAEMFAGFEPVEEER